MNRQDLEFTLHDGDLKAGNSTPGSVTPTDCSDALYAQALRYFTLLRAPVVFTPATTTGPTAIVRRTARSRRSSASTTSAQVFFSTPFSLGRRRMRQQVQTEALCLGVNGPGAVRREPPVEHPRRHVRDAQHSGVLQQPVRYAPDPAEWAARNQAVIAWMRETFAEAAERHSTAIMLISQANPGWDLSDPTRAPLRNPRTLAQTDGQPDGFQEFLLALREEVIAFRKPVAYVHGDSHYFRIDKPFLDAQGRRLENFTRVETFGNSAATGNNDVQWLKVLVTPRSREVFAYEPQIVPANRTAVPAP